MPPDKKTPEELSRMSQQEWRGWAGAVLMMLSDRMDELDCDAHTQRLTVLEQRQWVSWAGLGILITLLLIPMLVWVIRGIAS